MRPFPRLLISSRVRVCFHPIDKLKIEIESAKARMLMLLKNERTSERNPPPLRPRRAML